MPKNSGNRTPDVHPELCQAWRLYAQWGQLIKRQALDQADAADSPDADCGPVQRVADAFLGLVEHERIHLSALLRQADDRLAPFSDPLRLRFSGHRWLDPEREREESYSDWLAWLLEQMNSAEQVLRIFDLEDSEFGTIVRDKKPVVSREESIRTTTGGVKRLDIVVRFEDAGVLLVEVKIRDLSDAGGGDNLPIYGSWLERCWPDPKCRRHLAGSDLDGIVILRMGGFILGSCEPETPSSCCRELYIDSQQAPFRCDASLFCKRRGAEPSRHSGDRGDNVGTTDSALLRKVP